MGLGIFFGGKPPGAVSRGPVHAHPLWRRGARSSSPSSPLAKKAKKKKKNKKIQNHEEGRGGKGRRQPAAGQTLPAVLGHRPDSSSPAARPQSAAGGGSAESRGEERSRAEPAPPPGEGNGLRAVGFGVAPPADPGLPAPAGPAPVGPGMSEVGWTGCCGVAVFSVCALCRGGRWEGKVCISRPSFVGFGFLRSARSWVRLFSSSEMLRPGCEEELPGCA